jgi:hypothetical protein
MEVTVPEVRQRKAPVDSRIERQICIGLIIDDRFLRELKPLYSPNSFQTGFIRRVAGWCLEYHEKYGKTPGKHIEDLYLQHRAEVPEDETKLLEEFLAGLSEEYERVGGFNGDYVRDKAEQHFRLTSLRTLQTKLQQSIVAGNPEDAEELVKCYRRPARRQNQGVDPLRDVDSIVRALVPEDSNKDIIMRLPGDLGEAAGPFERGFFVAVQAESGVGKTWWLWFMSQLAILLGFNTVFFSMEMSTLKMIQRIWQDIAGLPSVDVPTYQLSKDGQILIPVFDCEKNQTNECREVCDVALVKFSGNGEKLGLKPAYRDASPDYKPCSKCRGTSRFRATAWWKVGGKRDRLDPSSALKKHAALDRSGVLKRAGKFHMVEFPSRRYTMDDLITYLNNLEYYEDFIPSVIVTDYADKLKWKTPGDPRVSIGEIWDSHKGLAQERHCLVITASQSNTMRSGKQVGRGSWSESQEKEHLLDLGIAFNQSSSDQASGIIRASLAKKRHGQMERVAEVVVLQQLAIGRPYIDSCRLVKEERK